jgi:hypothetical protein
MNVSFKNLKPFVIRVTVKFRNGTTSFKAICTNEGIDHSITALRAAGIILPKAMWELIDGEFAKWKKKARI